MTGKRLAEKPLFVTQSGVGEDSDRVAACLGAEVAARYGPRDETRLSIFAYDESDALIAGLNGAVHWGWCYIRHFWVAVDWRGHGLGRLLLARAETETRLKSCVGLYLDTFDPGAARFYERCGFQAFGRIEDFPPGHARTFLYKKLPASSA
jgi:GNAT superfamily N-acetyltransferase